MAIVFGPQPRKDFVCYLSAGDRPSLHLRSYGDTAEWTWHEKLPRTGRGGGEPCGIRRASEMRDDGLYNASLRVGSASGNRAQASPHKTMHGLSVGGRGGQTAKAPLHRRFLPTGCTCPNGMVLRRDGPELSGAMPKL
jgi:hypothetical protein